MTDPSKPTTVVTQPAAAAGGQHVITSVLPHGAKPVSVAEVAAANPQSADALLKATHMLDPLMGVVGGGANPAMQAMQSAIAHRGGEAAIETPQMPTTLKEHGKMTFVDAPKQHVTAQFEAPTAPLATTASAGHKHHAPAAAEAGGAAKPATKDAPKAGEVHPKQQAAPVDAGDGSSSGAHNGSGQKRKHPEAVGAAKDQGVVPTAAGDKAAPAPVDAATSKSAGEEGESAAKSTRP